MLGHSRGDSMKSKDRKRSGWTTPNSTLKMKKSDLINECLEPQEYYDDWNDYRDGMRDWMNDRTKIKKGDVVKHYNSWASERTQFLRQNNFKLKRLLRRRRVRKNSIRNQKDN